MYSMNKQINFSQHRDLFHKIDFGKIYLNVKEIQRAMNDEKDTKQTVKGQTLDGGPRIKKVSNCAGNFYSNS